jgi:hypothetical protein
MQTLIKTDIKAVEQRIKNHNWYDALAQENNAISTIHISAHDLTETIF